MMVAGSSPPADARMVRADRLQSDAHFEADVAVIGSGAGGAVSAEMLAKSGLQVVLIEEGAYRTKADFHMREPEAYPDLYYDIASRKTADNAVTVLQGRTVGGSTTVNWTSCFRAPRATLGHWADAHAVRGLGPDDLAPWFDMMERRLAIKPWEAARNGNNDALHRGATRLGWPTGGVPRNVAGCLDLGYCGMGCPVDAKQSMVVTAVPSALAHGAVLLSRLRALSLRLDGDRVTAVECAALSDDGSRATGRRVTVRARFHVVAGGAINSPALLLRSRLPDPHGVLGRRTFLHLVNVSVGRMAEPTDPFDGAPQSTYSDHFLWRDGVAGRVGYKLEVAPVHPAVASTLLKEFGPRLSAQMAELPYFNAQIALMRDGFHGDSPGSTVSLGDDGGAVLDYPISEYLWEGFRHSYLSMAECQFAAGARRVRPMHSEAGDYAGWAQARRAINELPLEIHMAQLFSAHPMGGCAMGEDPAMAVVASDGRHHQLRNLYVIDGSVFPTSLGANPSLTIYAIAARQAWRLAEAAGGTPVALVR